MNRTRWSENQRPNGRLRGPVSGVGLPTIYGIAAIVALGMGLMSFGVTHETTDSPEVPRASAV